MQAFLGVVLDGRSQVLKIPAGATAGAAPPHVVAAGFARHLSQLLAARRPESRNARGLAPVIDSAKTQLSPAWVALMAQLPAKRHRLGLSRFARYASAAGVDPGEVNDSVIDRFVGGVRRGFVAPQSERAPSQGDDRLERGGWLPARRQAHQDDQTVLPWPT